MRQVLARLKCENWRRWIKPPCSELVIRTGIEEWLKLAFSHSFCLKDMWIFIETHQAYLVWYVLCLKLFAYAKSFYFLWCQLKEGRFLMVWVAKGTILIEFRFIYIQHIIQGLFVSANSGYNLDHLAPHHCRQIFLDLSTHIYFIDFWHFWGWYDETAFFSTDSTSLAA